MASLVRGSGSPGCGAPRQGGSSIDPPIPTVLTIKHSRDRRRSSAVLRAVDVSTVLSPQFFDDAAASCGQLIRSSKPAFPKTTLEGGGAHLCFFQSTRLPPSEVVFSSSSRVQLNFDDFRLSLFLGHLPLGLVDTPQGQLLRPLRPRTCVQGGCLWATSGQQAVP